MDKKEQLSFSNVPHVDSMYAGLRWRPCPTCESENIRFVHKGDESHYVCEECGAEFRR